ncbi:helix-turn-helix domain-containing protein [Chitinophaga sp. SYP-B3965]|uniref:AraC family transcriptional regulator n=1 Tax=Chitinophaga sp. SYP-B3965 TaxID=2663120 RepID=UPI0012997E53|nr:AraC family transcriptional regulator [Chitinophaga sp. SYP-B3965]MRG45760.1 helix-turn-helix domain-containing protein [Chitinophaga sp. SYP-B3965]
MIKADTVLEDSFSITYRDHHIFPHEPVCRIDYHRIFLILEGAGSIQIDDNTYPISGNEIFLLARGQLFAFKKGTTISGYELSFGDCFWEKAPASANNCKAVLFNNAAANQHLPLDKEEIAFLFQVLLKEFLKETYVNKTDALAAYLKIIMIKIANINASLIKGYDNHEKQVYREFLGLVSQQYQSTHEVAAFATQLNISARKLTELCKRCAGVGAKDIINGQLIGEAKRALQFSSKPVKEIAYSLNFLTPEQFSHFFKKYTRLSPKEYRERFVKIGM